MNSLGVETMGDAGELEGLGERERGSERPMTLIRFSVSQMHARWACNDKRRSEDDPFASVSG